LHQGCGNAAKNHRVHARFPPSADIDLGNALLVAQFKQGFGNFPMVDNRFYFDAFGLERR